MILVNQSTQARRTAHKAMLACNILKKMLAALSPQSIAGESDTGQRARRVQESVGLQTLVAETLLPYPTYSGGARTAICARMGPGAFH